MPTFGVVIGRFQTPDLHQGHHYLLNTVKARVDQLIVLLGVTGGQATTTDPLDIEMRKELILEAYPQTIIYSLADSINHEMWSQAIDVLLSSYAAQGEVILFGSRDSFIPCYLGRFATCEIEPLPQFNATRDRAHCAETRINHSLFRRGAIYAAMKRYPTAYPTVDIAIVRRSRKELLLAQKPGETQWRFIGGFVDPTDIDLESAAYREAYEETGGIEITRPRYVASFKIDDHRYRKSLDGIMTSLFLAEYRFGTPLAQDDIAVLKWIKWKDVEALTFPAHQPLWQRLKTELI